ncbi:MAG TPA: hypothetical protein VIK96_04315 [Bacilli bacterium]
MAKNLYVKSVILKKSTLSFLIIIFGLLSIIMFLLTLYGSSSGNFMIATDPDAYERGIVLSETAEFTEPSSRLFATTISNVEDMTYDNLALEAILNAEGDYFDPINTYLAYTFYLKNNGKETVTVEYSLTIQEMNRNVEEAIRFVFIDDGYIQMFQKPDSVPKEYKFIVNRKPDEIINFTDSEVFRFQITDFKPEDVKHFSIIMYIEGNDDDCNDSILGGSLKASMQFSIVEPKS